MSDNGNGEGNREERAMHKRAVVAGVSQLKSWGPTTTVADALNSLGQNSGNMMFTESICRVLDNAQATSFAPPASALEGRDAIVLAAANWINEFDDFAWLANVLERTQLPVFLIGVGAQASMTMEVPNLKPGTLRLLKLVAERSTSIAARGEFTCEVLAHYGIKNAVPTGCPSLLLAGAAGPIFAGPATADRVVVHATRHGFLTCDALQRFLYKQALKQDLELLLQSEHADIYFALDKTNNPDILARATEAVRFAYGTDDIERVSAYLRRRGLFFTDYEEWIGHMRTRSFSIGTRIHGTIASIIAGTRALLLVHDSRTLEMARSMNIPHLHSSAVDIEKDLRIEDYLDAGQGFDLVDGYAAYYRRYMDFFAANKLAVTPELETSLTTVHE